MPSSLYQCQCQCTVPAANQISSKSVLPDDYHGETNHHWPKVLLPQAIALLSPGSSRALTTSSSSHIDFLFLLCFVWFGRISFLLVEFLHFYDINKKGTSLNVHLQRQNSGFSFPNRLWLIWRVSQKPRKSRIYLFFPFAVLWQANFRMTGRLDVLHRLDIIARKSQKLTGTTCLVGSPQAKWVVPGPRRHWVGGKKKRSFKGETAWTHG